MIAKKTLVDALGMAAEALQDIADGGGFGCAGSELAAKMQALAEQRLREINHLIPWVCRDEIEFEEENGISSVCGSLR